MSDSSGSELKRHDATDPAHARDEDAGIFEAAL